MELYHRAGSPHWYVDYVDPSTGERRRRSTQETSKKAAKQAALAMIATGKREVARGKVDHRGRKATTLGAVGQQYVHYLEAHKKSAWRHARCFWARAVDHWGDTKKLHTLRVADLEGFVTMLLGEGLAPSTVDATVRCVRSGVRHAAALGAWPPDDLLMGRDWRAPKVTPKTRWLTREEWQAIYTALGKKSGPRQQARDLMVLLTMTGGRLNEVRSLTWDRVDTVGFGVIRLWGSKVSKDRLVPVPELAREVLRRRWAEAAKGEARVFPGDRSSQGVLHEAFKVVNTPAKVADLGRATLHSLRHTHASWLLQNGADLAEVQESLGHADIGMTRRYAHLSQQDNADRLAMRLNGVTIGITGDRVCSPVDTSNP